MSKCTLLALGVVTLLASGRAASAQEPARDGAGTTAAQPSGSAGPALVDYVVGPEDVLAILFWREQDMTAEVAVRPDGRITLPLLGDIQAAGLHPAELSAAVQASAAKYLTDPTVTVVVRQINSRKVFITGLVNAPGTYPLTGPRTVMQLIALAGGVTEFADAEDIKILRQEQGRTRAYSFNYKDVSKGKSLQQNVQLRPGDTVVVP